MAPQRVARYQRDQALEVVALRLRRYLEVGHLAKFTTSRKVERRTYPVELVIALNIDIVINRLHIDARVTPYVIAEHIAT